MTSDKMKNIMYNQGRLDALNLQERSSGLSGTDLNAEDEKIPFFKAAVAAKNMLDRKAGQTDGFVCKSTAGRVVRLIQNYDSDIFKSEPEELPAQFRFVWSTDPAKAKPFVSLSTSPYGKGECCTENGQVFRSTIDGNIWSPSDYPAGWEVAV